jgi:Carbohydrate binding domain
MRINTIISFLFSAFLTIPAFGQSGSPALWYWQNAYPQSPSDVASIETQIDLAFSYGYTGVAFWSSAFTFMGSTVHPANNVTYMQQVISYAQSKGMKTMASTSPYGYSDDALLNNPNWAEGEHITGSQFTVNSTKTALVPVNSFGGLANPGFESGMTGWFAWNDLNMGIDPNVAHSGNASGSIVNASGDSRFVQTLNLIPWRQYHARIWIKTSNFQGFAQIEVWDPSTNLTTFNTPITQQATQDWTELDFTFNSRASTQPLLLFGVWNGSSGTMWFDDVLVEETSLVYVLRRSGTPLTVYNPTQPTTVFQEGTDFNAIADPQLASGGLFNGFYHTPSTVTLPATTSLQPGQTVAIDFYAAQPIQPGGDVGMCLTEPGAQSWLQQNAQAIVSSMPSGMNYLLSYDEMRHMDSCASCKAKNLTPGQLLASHVANTYNLYHSLAPTASYYIWGDMFDPYSNAVNNYYFVEGDIAGSWTGIPSPVTIMNWNLGNLANSLSWFAGLNSQQPTHYNQVIAGYYDSGDGAGAATQELQQAAGIPGVTGLMYTTWVTDYSQLQPFAAAAKAGWSAYLASVVSNVTPQLSVVESVVTYNRVSHIYSQSVKLTNNGAALPAAAYALDNLNSGVTMISPDGFTSAALPAGSPYKEVGPIGAGATVTFTIQFTVTGTPPITYTARALGSGPR